jgi:hypothetical protein
MHNFFRGKKWPKNVGYFCNFQKLPTENNRPMGENSTNLVTVTMGKVIF